MLAVPALWPVTIPVAASAVAIVLLLLLHVPPPIVLVNVIVCPAHTVAGPEIAGGKGLTVTIIVL